MQMSAHRARCRRSRRDVDSILWRLRSTDAQVSLNEVTVSVTSIHVSESADIVRPLSEQQLRERDGNERMETTAITTHEELKESDANYRASARRGKDECRALVDRQFRENTVTNRWIQVSEVRSSVAANRNGSEASAR